MLEYETKLSEISKQIDDGQPVSNVTVRTFLAWFGAQRRGYTIVQVIRFHLMRYHLGTQPDFEVQYIDGAISFVRAEVEFPTTKPAATEMEIPKIDPTYRIGRLASANKELVSATPDESLQSATTKMLMNDFSQLPVMTSDREVKGMISWSSIGNRLVLGKKCETVKDCMEKHYEVTADTSLFAAIDAIISNEYVLVRGDNKIITGIVTTSDLSVQFLQLGEPFLLLGEIENQIRRMMKDKFTPQEFSEVKDPSDTQRTVESVADLTFGEYVRLLENPERWTKLKLAIARDYFIKRLIEVKDIRNDVMHFDPDGIAPSDLEKLRQFVGFLQGLSEVGAI